MAGYYYGFGYSRDREQSGLRASRASSCGCVSLAPPVDGAANAACVAFMAKALGVSRSRVQIQAGHKGRNKVLYIADLTPQQAATALGMAES